jgi:transcriptional regulator with XRE-family HTH domain
MKINTEVWMDRIRQLRKEHGLSQVKLAVMADMDPATLNRLEQGKGNPNLKTLERVADALGVEVADFFPKAPGRSSPEPSFNDVLEGERQLGAAKTFTDNLNHFAQKWQEEAREPEKQGVYWCLGVQATAIGLTDVFRKLGFSEMIGRKLREVREQSPAGLVEEIKKGKSGRAMRDADFRVAMSLLTAFEDMHDASDHVLEVDETVDWITIKEAEQRRKAFSVIQGDLSA